MTLTTKKDPAGSKFSDKTTNYFRRKNKLKYLFDLLSIFLTYNV